MSILPTLAPSTLPIQAPHCPLCGGPNGCAPSLTGSFAERCWCHDLKLSPQLLARIPAAARGQACVCRQCAQAPPEPCA